MKAAQSISSLPISNYTTVNKKKMPRHLKPEKIRKHVDNDDSDGYESELKQNEMQVLFVF
jgi:hypothetical protein